MNDVTGERFVSESVTPVPGTGLASTAVRGEPALPGEFTWRRTRYHVTEILRVWKTTGPCDHGSSEQYVRRHWYRVAVEPHAVMTLYFDRQARDRRHPKARWWLYTIEAAADSEEGPVR